MSLTLSEIIPKQDLYARAPEEAASGRRSQIGNGWMDWWTLKVEATPFLPPFFQVHFQTEWSSDTVIQYPSWKKL